MESLLLSNHSSNTSIVKFKTKLNKGIPKNQRMSFKESGRLKFDNNYHEISLITHPENKEENKNGHEAGDVESSSK